MLPVVALWLWWLLVPRLMGGLLGALRLSWSGDRSFVDLVPWLMLAATLLLLLAHPFLTQRQAGGSLTRPKLARLLAAMSAIFVVAIYGGYFGAGIGITA